MSPRSPPNLPVACKRGLRHTSTRSSLTRDQVNITCPGMSDFSRNGTVDVSPELCQMLKQHLNDRAAGYVFRTRNGTAFGQENCRRMLHNILRQSGIAKGGLHAFRHGRVSILQASGVPGDLIKEWVGHSSLRTTSR
jgi:integrase